MCAAVVVWRRRVLQFHAKNERLPEQVCRALHSTVLHGAQLARLGPGANFCWQDQGRHPRAGRNSQMVAQTEVD